MERPDSEVLRCSVDDGVATVVLDRPEKRNAMGLAFWEDLPALMGALDDDQEVRCVVIAANGPHFSVGLDLAAMGGTLSGSPEQPPSKAQEHRALYEGIKKMQWSLSSVAACRKPVIAAIHGYCIGGGVDLVAACDIRIASDDAIFSVREAKLAIVADVGSLQRLPSIISAGHLAELAFTGKDIDAARAERIGLINDVVAGGAAGALAASQSLAAEIAANSPLAVQGTKAVLAANDGRTVDEALDFVAWWNAAYLRSEDLTEAMTAFFEKRPARFTGR